MHGRDRRRTLVGCSLWLALLGACKETSPQPEARFEPATARPPAAEAVDAGSPWWRSVVFYELFVRSFADSSSGPLSGDGIGDLEGLVERLDYLNDGDPDTSDDLEIGGLWLMPVMQSPSYHGYDVTDYRTIEKDYGGNADFRRLVDQAHRRGIRVVVDLVLNHTSSAHPWFRDAWRGRSPYHDWYIWSFEPQDYRGPWGQPVWHAAPWWQRGWRHFNHMSYYGIFWSGMPDLDYRRPQVTRAMQEICRFWIEQMGVDGFRLDAVRHLIEDGTRQQDTPETHAWLKGFQRTLESEYPAVMTVGEIWAETEVVATYGHDELDLTFQFALAREILQAVATGSAADLIDEAQAVWSAFPDGGAATFLSNHDQMRVMSALDGEVERAKLAATLLLTSPGVPFLYYGEEIGTRGTKPDPNLRRPMAWTTSERAGFSTAEPWEDLPLEATTVNVALQNRDPSSLLSHYRRLIRLRNRHPALRVGGFTVATSTDDRIYAFVRRSEQEQILVVVNLGDRAIADYALELESMSLETSEGGAILTPIELLSGSRAAPLGFGPYRPLDELEARSAYLFLWPLGRIPE